MELISFLVNGDVKFNTYRLFHTKKYRGKNFEKQRKELSDNGRIIEERDLINDYLIESNEIYFTTFLIFFSLTILSLISSFILLFSNVHIILSFISICLTSILFFTSRYVRERLIMNNFSIDLTTSFYNKQFFS